MDRLSAFADALFSGARVYVVAIHFDDRDQELELLAPMGAVAFVPPPDWISALEDSFADPSRARFALAQAAWRSGMLDAIWLACAEDRLGRVAVFDPITGSTMCPYDGGADQFVWDDDRRRGIRQRFRDWLPEEGLPGSPADLQE